MSREHSKKLMVFVGDQNRSSTGCI